MRVITLECPECGTVVAANEIEDNRIMKCPGNDCESVLRFDDLPEDDRSFYLKNREQYRL
ncbi:hypothetical protein EXE51_16290 [Halorubrum sp. CGM5_25_10-8B]|uniref:hypothetical protein n=1 Tax=Halorubrum sp. CGM5_25_10-8B TaxID=2518115 RepID=UPI0010F68146|nr:hypothetical protein [Halorubrum sp. CGM5_25_10-8B]TKX35079.1 hypothetical protein EXE51_16290 [Halorubrum sp. CGM5_25_10-8B]